MTASIEEIERRLRIMEDIEEIKQLHVRYLDAYGTFNVPVIMESFARDAVADVRPAGDLICKGKKEIEKMFLENFNMANPPRKLPMDARFAVHPLITVTGDTAKAKWTYYHLHSHPRTCQSLFWIQGIYTVDLVREDGRWKFNYLKWRPSLGMQLGTPPYEGMDS